MAWAMDECNLSAEFFTQTLHSVNLNTDSKLISPKLINSASPNTINLIDMASNYSPDNDCNTSCAGWTHLHYVDFKTPVINVAKIHNDVMPRSFIYHFSQRKPPIEPPKV